MVEICLNRASLLFFVLSEVIMRTEIREETWTRLRTELRKQGYHTYTEEHGGYGGGTKLVVMRDKKFLQIAMWLCCVPLVVAVFALMETADPRFGALIIGLTVIFLWFVIPAFQAKFMWWDSPDEESWVSEGRTTKADFYVVTAIIEEVTGKRVR